mgnify:CR=1 FL=1
MKNIVKITVMVLFCLLFGVFSKTQADTYNVNDNVSLGKYNIYYRQGSSYIRYRGVGQLNYMYYYRDYNNIEHKAFCLNLGLKGAEAGDYTLDANTLIQDSKVASILISGSPYKSLGELGLNNEDEATFATQFAVWIYLNNLDINQITPYASGNENVVEAIKKIYNDGMNMRYNSSAILNINKIGVSGIDSIDREYYSQRYSLDYNENIKNVNLSITGVDNIKLTDLNNNSISNIKGVKEFKILIPRDSISKDEELILNLGVDSKQTSVMFGATNISDRQNMGLLLSPVNSCNIQDKFTIKYEPAKVKIEKVDKDTGIGIKGVKFRFETLDGKHLGDFITGENGVIDIDAEKELKIGNEQQIKVTEIEVPDNYYFDKDNCTQIINVKYGETVVARFENEKIKGKIKLIKYSSKDNKYTGLTAKSTLKDVYFEVYDMENNLVDTIKTDENGIAITRDLLKGKYKFKEVKQAKYYLLNDEVFEIEIKNHKEVVEQEVFNDSVDIDIEIEKYGFVETQNKDNIFYDFKNIHNKSNVSLDNFTWNDILPTESVRIDKLYTGTWNEKLEYSVYYKTNKNDFRVFKEKLNSETVYELDFKKLELDRDEYVTEVEFRFGTVMIDFHEIESPILYVDVLDNLKNGNTFTNKSKVSGNYLEEHIEDEDNWTTIIYNKKVKLSKELPKTGV